ncbi:hypothetical protein EOL96_05490 [Candidatus Saccharibacteria bacterium]|nr:hypothetical protein [Candidatus Saccharibacteria bacterium]
MIWQSDTKLYDQNTFYDRFTKDLLYAKTRVIIESPFMTSRRVNQLLPILEKLTRRGVKVIINTKPYDEHDTLLQEMAYEGVVALQEIGVTVLMTVGHHRKLAIIDDVLSWEGSLNILSQNDSCEIMRRISSKEATCQLVRFINLDRYYN